MLASLTKTIRKIYKETAGFLLTRYLFAKIFIGIMVSTLIAVVFLCSGLDKFELVTLDQRFKLRPCPAANKDIAIIEMSDDSIDAIGRWPWPREWHATLLSILKKYDARLVIFDVIFDKPSAPSQDAVFGEALRAAGNVYLPFAFQFREGYLPINTRPLDNVRNVIYPMQEFDKASRGSGYVNISPDIDGVLRRVPLVIRYGNKLYPQIAFKAALDYLGVKEEDIIVKPGRRIILKNSAAGKMDIPIGPDNEMIVSWAGPWKGSFRHYSFADIIVSYGEMTGGKKPRINLNELRGKICVVGLTAPGLYDIRPTPLEPSYPAVGINANIINDILKRDFVKKVPRFVDISLIYLMGILIPFLVSKLRFIRRAFYTAAAVIGYTAALFFAFTFFGMWISAVYPVLAMLVSFLGVTLYNEVILATEGKKYFDLSTMDGLTRLFNISHFKEILDQEIDISSGKRKTPRLCLIMADVDHFKEFNDKYGHQAGDLILKRVAAVFRANTRRHDVVARYGGEEFIMMLPWTEMEDALLIAERIRRRIEGMTLKRHGQKYNITISLGIAILGEEKTKEELIKKADEALYLAKGAGRNRVCVK